jgi:hypothetical protein
MEQVKLDECVGHAVRLSFYDHCRGSHTVVRCDLFGILKRVTPDVVVVASWLTHDAENNDDNYAIVRSAIFAVTDMGELADAR